MTNSVWSHTKNAFDSEFEGRSSATFIDSIATRFRAIGAYHILITGLPLPGRDIGKLVLYQDWGPEKLSLSQLASIRGDDILLRRIAVLSKPMRWRPSEAKSEWIHQSNLLTLLKDSSADPLGYSTIIGVHIHQFNNLQLAICLAGSEMGVSDRELTTMATAIQLELTEMHAIRPIVSSRPGELSVREKLVLSLTAEGKTAGTIADELRISQRTVHAHLQNASEKMQAANKTQTVVEAMRYGQIQLS